MISVPAEEMTQLFTVAIIDDSIVECDETFIITILSVTTCGVTISNRNNRTVVMIADVDGG